MGGGLSSQAELLAELARVKALFQLRALAAVMGLPAPTSLPNTTTERGKP